MKAGRPLRFLSLVLGGWVMLRLYAMHQPPGPARRTETATRAPAAITLSSMGGDGSPSLAHALVALHQSPALPPLARSGVRWIAQPPVMPAPPTLIAPDAVVSDAAWVGLPSIPEKALMPTVLSPIPPRARRLSGSAWLIAREGMAALAATPQLGGSQAGVRILYRVDDARRLSLSARLSAPLAGQGREAAAGVDWQPSAAPIHLLAEQRVALDGGRGGPTLAVIGGFGPTSIARGVRVEGYGQAGVIARDHAEAFADGALRAAHVIRQGGAWSIDAGVGVWGGAQQGASRLDIGPSLGIGVPVGTRRVRVTAEWRERIAGTARPASGPALSLGTDF